MVTNIVRLSFIFVTYIKLTVSKIFARCKYRYIICIINLNVNRVTNRVKKCHPRRHSISRIKKRRKTIMIAIKNNNKITREELARLIKKIQEQFKEYSMV